MTPQEIDRIQNAIRHIQTAVDIDPRVCEIAVEALKAQLSSCSEIQNSSDDLISRQEVLQTCQETIWNGADGYDPISAKGIAERVKNLPSAKPEQKTGRWIYDGEYKNGMVKMKCSICGKVIETFEYTSQLKYCQNCGAKMEDKNEPERF